MKQLVKEINLEKKGMSSDMLRCIATLAVFLLHGRSHITKINELPYVLKWISCFPAWAGVWIFLFLSGYGVGYGFFSGKYNLYQNNRISLKLFVKFYIGRFIKIAPIYYIYCIIFEVLSGNMYFWSNQKVLIKMFTFTFNGNDGISGLGHLWYISLAMQLYLFMPIIYLIVNRIKRNKKGWILLFGGIAICGMFIRCYIVSRGYPWYTYSYTNCWTNIDLIALGMMVSKIKLEFNIAVNNRNTIKICAGGLFAALFLYNCYIYEITSANYTFIYQCILPTAYAINCSLILLLSDGCFKRSNSGFIEKMITSFSKYSYAFYIWHIAVFQYLDITLIQTQWFNELGACEQYIIFFVVCSIINLILAIPFTYISKEISLEYSRIEKQVFK